VNLVDSHNHLHFNDFRKDRSEVMDRARQAGVKAMLLVGIDPDDTCRAIETAEAGDGLFASVGIHPQMAGVFSPDDVLALEALAQNHKIVAVGETGFDLYRTPDTENQQKELFRAHIELARTCSLPLIIHDRDAHRQTLDLLEEEGAWSLGGMFHCFSGDAAMARQIVDKGFFLSVPGVLTYKNAAVLRQAVRACPLESLLVETDAPYLAPVPYRGKRNEPSFLIETVRELAAIRKLDAEQMAEITTENFFRLFARRSMPLNHG
jgi:TatD DNase family protein